MKEVALQHYCPNLRTLSIWLIGLAVSCFFYSCNRTPLAEEEEPNIEEKILKVTGEWIGTPYRMGGTTKDGIDCSAFTQIVFKDVFKIELPRRVKDQKLVGTEVPKEEMRPGDLVVFKTGVFFTNKQHIGIYLSDNNFIHASSSKGVTISSLEESYWKKKYRSSRRLIDENRKPWEELQVASQ